MIRISALNEETEDESEGEEEVPSATKEAQEEKAFSLYNKALELQREEQLEEAEATFREVLSSKLVSEATQTDGKEGLTQPALVLKYSILKNLGNNLLQQGKLKRALEHYVEALQLDDSDVTLWYKVGTVATEVSNFNLSCLAFQEGLRCSPNHWPCLDNLVTLLYVTCDYLTCLFYIARGLERDPEYLKGLAFRDQILKELPSYAERFNAIFKGYDISSDAEYDVEEGQVLIDEALELRKKIEPTYIEPRPTVVDLVKSLDEFTWHALGESLNATYKHISKSDLSFSCKVILKHASSKEENRSEDEDMQVDDQRLLDASFGDSQRTSYHTSQDEEMSDAQGNPDSEREREGNGMEREEGGLMDEEQRRRGTKRRRSLIFLEMWEGKRRSARVRSTVARRETEKDEISIGDLLKRFLPLSLLPEFIREEKPKESLDMDDSMDTMDLYRLFEKQDNSESSKNKEEHEENTQKEDEKKEKSEDENYFGTEKEQTDVELFLNANKDNIGVVEVLMNYVISLSSKDGLKWPDTLLATYVEAYENMRPHVAHPCPITNNEDLDWLKTDAVISLMYGELFLDKWLTSKEKLSKNHNADEKLSSELVMEDMGYMIFISERGGLFGAKYLNYLLRLYWLKAHVFLYQGSTEVAIQSLETILYYLEIKPEDQEGEVTLYNCKHNTSINRERTEKMLINLERNQKLEKVQKLYEQREYEELALILQATFEYSQAQSLHSPGSVVPDRPTQLALLLEALWHLKEYERCFEWGEACCNEALHKYLNSSDCKEQQKWATTMEKLLAGLDSCIQQGGVAVVEHLPSNKLTRLVQNLIHIVSHQLDTPDHIIELPIETIIPWTLLHEILGSLEARDELQVPECWEKVPSDIPASIMMLFTAHDYLGRRSWCCTNEGALLLYILDFIIPKIRSEEFSKFRNKLSQGLEQVFYCLYSHPSKKTKARYLQDHGVPPIALTWERAMQLYEFFRPDEVPEFDSYRVGSITSDVENVLKRISALVPSHCDPTTLAEVMNAYINGERDSLPTIDEDHSPLPDDILDIYYLLGDYYFKNNEWAKAIKNYLLDTCVNPDRLDSWAGMALARGSQLETKLNSCDPLKSENDFLKKAQAAQRCFQRAVDIDSGHSLMWIEYGSFVYTVHSFCSRLLKQETHLSLEMFEIVEKHKEEMLDIAFTCFTSANRVWYTLGEEHGIQDERWLHHYMLGKIAEKKDEDPVKYLNHYKEASKFLHLNNACYPKRINYNSPPDLSMEALEVHYRIHACILKCLEQYEGKPLSKELSETFEKYLKEAAESPFVTCQGKVSKEAEGGKNEENLTLKANNSDETVDEKSKRTSSEAFTEDNSEGPEEKKICLMSDHEEAADNLLQDVRHTLDFLLSNVEECSKSTKEEDHKFSAPQSVRSKKSEDKEKHTLNSTIELDSSTDEESNVIIVISSSEVTDSDSDITDSKGGKVPCTKSGEEEITDSKEGKVPCTKSSQEEKVEETQAKTSKDADSSMEVDSQKVQGDKTQPQDDAVSKREEAEKNESGKDASEHGEENTQIVEEEKVAGTAEELESGNEASSQSETDDKCQSEKADEPKNEKTLPLEEVDKSRAENEQKALSKEDEKSQLESKKSDDEKPQKSDETVKLEVNTLTETKKEISSMENAVTSNLMKGQEILLNSSMEADAPRSEPAKKTSTPHEENKDKTESDALNSSGAATCRRSSQESTTSVTTTTSITSTSETTGVSSTSTSGSELSSESSSNSDSSDESEEENKSKETVVEVPVAGTAKGEKEDKKKEAEIDDASKKGSQNKEDKEEAKKVEGKKSDEKETKQKKQVEKSEKKERNAEKVIIDHHHLIMKCIKALEECVLRFPQHYKSLYRITHYYFRSNFHRDVQKCWVLLLGPKPGTTASSAQSLPGLFADRRGSNFFNGVWRIPVSEIDRPGSFASHMSRCVLLLMEVLIDLQDYKMLLELCLHLRRTPDAEKKYLRDTEREQYSHQALVLTIQAIRNKVRSMAEKKADIPTSKKLTFLLEIYRAYQRVQRHMPQKEGMFSSHLIETYKIYKDYKVDSSTPLLDQAVKFCQQEIYSSRIVVSTPSTTSTPGFLSPSSSAATAQIVSLASTLAMASAAQRKPITTTPKSSTNMLGAGIKTGLRGRPPGRSMNSVGILKPSIPGAIHQPLNRLPGAISTPLSSRTGPRPSGRGRGNISPMYPMPQPFPYYPMHSIFSDPSILTAAVQAKIPAVDAMDLSNLMNLNAQIGGFQAEFLRHFATSSLQKSSSNTASTRGRGGRSSHSAAAQVQKAMKDRPQISITPVSSKAGSKCTQSPQTYTPKSTPPTPYPPVTSQFTSPSPKGQSSATISISKTPATPVSSSTNTSASKVHSGQPSSSSSTNISITTSPAKTYTPTGPSPGVSTSTTSASKSNVVATSSSSTSKSYNLAAQGSSVPSSSTQASVERQLNSGVSISQVPTQNTNKSLTAKLMSFRKKPSLLPSSSRSDNPGKQQSSHSTQMSKTSSFKSPLNLPGLDVTVTPSSSAVSVQQTLSRLHNTNVEIISKGQAKSSSTPVSKSTPISLPSSITISKTCPPAGNSSSNRPSSDSGKSQEKVEVITLD